MPPRKPTSKEPLACGPSSPSHQSDFNFLDCCPEEASLPLARPPRTCTSYEKLPLPEDYFSNVMLTQEHEQVYRNEVARTVDQLFEVERRFLKQGSRIHKEWKHINKKFDFDFYHKIPKSRGVPTPPVVISIGTIPGTVEDLLFGDYTPDQQSYMQRTAYVDTASIRDARIISKFAVPHGTPYTNKNFSYISLKWCITRIPLPGADLFIKPRDWLYYEALGFTAPQRGDATNADPVGYFIMRPSELANVRPFSSSVLGRYACVSLYRQIAPDCVQIFTEVDVDLAGEMVGSSLAVQLGVTMSSRPFEIVRYVESMKLAELNRIQSQVIGEKEHGRTDHCLNCRRDVRTFMGRLSTTIRKCSICGSPICSRCRIKKRMAGKNLKRKLWCCQRCILTTRTNIFRSTELASATETPSMLHSLSDTEDVVDANTLDIFEICDKDAIDSLGKLSNKTDTCVDLATLSIEPEQCSTSSPSSTKYDESTLPTKITEAQIDLDSRTSTSHASGSVDEVNSFDCSSNWRNSYVSSPSTVGLSGYQISMYQQMIALRKAAETAYELTQANRKAMKN